ncbi:MAG: glycosyltransferase family 4 protein [Candidatus Omnitrophica bacterium]|jgi:alpha-1,3-mannosyltransferase|nr:glycosyltransferase family 4 protein [Candidatus Omnitrophota bacterium]
MRVVHITRQFYPCIGGVENVVLNIARRQSLFGYDVSVLTLNRNYLSNSLLPSDDNYNGIKIKRISFFGSKRYPIALSVLSYIKDADILHIHCVDFFVDYLVLLKTIHRKKIILHTHGGFFHSKWVYFFKKIYFNTITRIILHGCDKIIAVSKHDYELFNRISKNIICINNGVDIEKYGSITKNIDYGTLLYVGRIDENKKIHNLIKVTALLVEREYKIKLKIVGADWKDLKPELQRFAEYLGIKDNISFLGQVSDDDLMNEMSKAHVFVSASEYEAFGISSIEAMASGTVCVLNNISSFRQFIVAENCGILTDFNNFKNAGDAVSKVLDMTKEEYFNMGANAKEIAKQYSWDAVAERIFSLYKKVLLNNEAS